MMMRKKRRKHRMSSNEWSAMKEGICSVSRAGRLYTDRMRRTITTLSQMWAASLSFQEKGLNPMKKPLPTWSTIYRDSRILKKKAKYLIDIRN
jgi:hypothetical protein